MSLMVWGLLIAFGVILAGLILVGFGIYNFRNTAVNDRLQEYITGSEKHRPSRAPGAEREYSGSLIRRTLFPAFRNMVSFFGKFAPQRSMQALNHKLAIAHNPLGMRAPEYDGMRFLVLLVGIGLALMVNSREVVILTIVAGFAMIMFCFIAPILWLNIRVRKIQDEIRKSLPDVLDMLSVCADAGLGFDQSMQKVSDYWQTALGIELKRVVSEMEVGVSRTDALRNMSTRLDVGELSSFVAIIVQSEILGMRIADVLHSQAEQMRILRQFRAKEIAYRLPSKMMVPLALLIFPALIAVVLGPVVPRLIEDLF